MRYRRGAKGFEQIVVATFGDVEHALEHAKGALGRVRVEYAPTATFAKDATTLSF